MAKRGKQGVNRDVIKHAAATMFAERGYYASTLRDLARKVDITLGTVYHYFPSKEDLLVELIDDAMTPLIEAIPEVEANLDRKPPGELLAWMVKDFILGTLQRLGTATISDTELRALSRRNLARAVAQRDAYQRMMERVVEEGVRQGVFSVKDPKLTVYAILAACNGVPRWFKPGGRAGGEQIADQYAELALRMVGDAGDGTTGRKAGKARGRTRS